MGTTSSSHAVAERVRRLVLSRAGRALLAAGTEAAVLAAASDALEALGEFAPDAAFALRTNEPTKLRRTPAAGEPSLHLPLGRGAVIVARGDVPRELQHDLESLALAVRLALDRAVLSQALRSQALHDSLTGVSNRSHFVTRVEEALARAVRHASPVAIVYVELDNFKRVNDELGHEVGDEVLVELARRLRATARSHEVVARVGGDEFALLAEGVPSRASADALVERMRRTLAGPFHAAGRSVDVSASVGIVVAEADEAGGALLHRVDMAMHGAKRRRAVLGAAART